METITYAQVQDLIKRLPEDRLPVAYRLLHELAEHGELLQPQLDFLRLPLPERRRILAEQAEEMKGHYEETADERTEWQAGDFIH